MVSLLSSRTPPYLCYGSRKRALRRPPLTLPLLLLSQGHLHDRSHLLHRLHVPDLRHMALVR